jgi:predicted permease
MVHLYATEQTSSRWLVKTKENAVNKTRTLILSLVLFLITVPSTVFADGGYSDNSRDIEGGLELLFWLFVILVGGYIAGAFIGWLLGPSDEPPRNTRNR